MWENPVLFPQTSNREGWLQTVQIFDDDTGDLINLLDNNGNALYGVSLEIRPPRPHGGGGYSGGNPYYDGYGFQPIIFSQLAQGGPGVVTGVYVSIPDQGTIQIQVPKSQMQKFFSTKTYDVFLVLDDTANDDGRQLFIGRLPVLFGGRET